jgi:hypothetical protein
MRLGLGLGSRKAAGVRIAVEDCGWCAGGALFELGIGFESAVRVRTRL